MKYEPKYTNFGDFGDEVFEEVIAAYEKKENVKDAIAKAIDDYVEAALKDWVKRFRPSIQISQDKLVLFLLGGIDYESIYDEGEEFTVTYDLLQEIESLADDGEFAYSKGAKELGEAFTALGAKFLTVAETMRQDEES